MKKILFYMVETLSMLILFILGILVLKPMYINAQALPEVSSYTFEVIEGGMQDAVSIGSQYKGISPYTDSLIATYEIVGALFYEYENLTGDSAALWFCDDDDVVVRSLNSSEVTYFENKPLYNRLGQIVDSTNVYYCSYNNGYFNGGCYLDSNGDILYENYDNEVPIRAFANIAYGGSLVEWSDWNNFYNFIRSESAENQFNFSFSDVDYSDLSVFIWSGYCSGNARGTLKQSVYFYCPNVVDLGKIQNWVGSNQSFSADEFRYNTNANFTLDINKDITNQFQGDNTYSYIADVRDNAYTYQTYNYAKSFRPTVFDPDSPPEGINFYSNYSYNDFLNFSPVGYNDYYFTFAYHNDMDYTKFYNIVSSNTEITSFVPLQDPNGSFINPSPIPNELIDLGSISELGNLSEIQPELNPDFDPAEVIDPNNFPEFVELPTSLPSSSNLPNNSPNVDPNPNPEGIPSIGENIGNIDNTNIPIISNLRYRFPFSIPFDIHDLISGLAVQREAPHFEWEIYFPVIDYTWNIDIDLSTWDNQAEIFRNCFLILFIIALGMWAYSHFFGS